ncbi:MAG: hypothetical protein O3A55_06305 [Bacteroidetes bacterium]|nr:hypothetical protein [Bacteroidota bacterium]
MFCKVTTRIFYFIIFIAINFIFLNQDLLAQDTTSVELKNLQSDSLKTETTQDSLFEISKDTISVQEDLLPFISPDTTIAEETTNILITPQVDTTSISNVVIEKSTEVEGYRGGFWGMTFAEVQTKVMELDNLGNNDMYPTKNGFEYTITINQRPTLLTFQFDNDRFYIARLLPRIFSKRKTDYVEAYDEYYEILFQKYGQPSREGFLKKDRSYQNTIEAVLLGYVKKYAVWNFKRTQIILLMKGILVGDPLLQKRGLQITISYSSKTILNEINERRAALKREEF